MHFAQGAMGSMTPQLLRGVREGVPHPAAAPEVEEEGRYPPRHSSSQDRPDRVYPPPRPLAENRGHTSNLFRFHFSLTSASLPLRIVVAFILFLWRSQKTRAGPACAHSDGNPCTCLSFGRGNCCHHSQSCSGSLATFHSFSKACLPLL